ncbi:ankyrin repeat-containing domain protein [Cantharellus anzutake]|uniref:ankyrin repeat-containing domain protein n=1 Tax=Cantharellus anzutake TaxID=1750568 RepID=UPI0019041E3F|nr:ankyrin repeat-containing domain protein [Cantharellus anzutake]KAF8333012.1 ankyrin repeat-containing domain protein [Cantharellus anzutake]
MSTLSIHQAASQNQTSLVRSLLIAAPTLLNAKDAKADVNARDSMGWTPLIISGHEPIVIELVAAGADVKAANDNNITPLHYAASKGRVEIGKLLIERGADINARDKANQLPLSATNSLIL